MKIRRTRMLVFQALFQHEFGFHPLDVIVKWSWKTRHIPPEIDVPAAQMCRAIVRRLDVLDKEIETLHQHFKLYSLSFCDKTILRIGLFTLQFPSENTVGGSDAALVINECLYLAHAFSGPKSYRLVHTLLDHWVRVNCPSAPKLSRAVTNAAEVELVGADSLATNSANRDTVAGIDVDLGNVACLAEIEDAVMEPSLKGIAVAKGVAEEVKGMRYTPKDARIKDVNDGLSSDVLKSWRKTLKREILKG